MLVPQNATSLVGGEMPLTDRLVEGSLINTVINPFLGRNNPAQESYAPVMVGLPNETLTETNLTTNTQRQVMQANPVRYNSNALQLMINSSGQSAAELKRAFIKLNKNLDRQLS